MMINFTDILCVIPARANSKRLPGKNTKELNGKPLVAHSIEYALNNITSNVVVTTNDKEVLKIASKHRVNVIQRPQELCSDETSTAEVLKHAVNEVKGDYSFVVLLQPTSPLRPINLFDEAWTLLNEKKGKCLITVSANKHKLGKVEEDTFLPSTYSFGQRSQDLDPLYFENGLLYISSIDLIKNGKIIDETSIALIVDHPYGTVDIDTENDWEWADFLIKKYQ